jgi:hypothetical protein
MVPVLPLRGRPVKYARTRRKFHYERSVQKLQVRPVSVPQSGP